MIIQIEALDTLFFRDGKPFTMGDETWANGIFPPPPSVFYGALRSAYFAQHPDDLELANTDSDPTKELVIKGIYIQEYGSPYFPVPLDLVESKYKDFNDLEDEDWENYITVNLLTSIKKEKTFFSSADNTNLSLLSLNEEIEGLDNLSFLKNNMFRQYQKGNSTSLKATPISKLILKENKIGIQRSRTTNTTVDGMLYRVAMNRLGNIKFAVDFEGLELDKEGLLKLGGEAKVATYNSDVIPRNFKILSKQDFAINTKIKIILLTPAIFKKGWIPSFIDGSNVKLISACVGKPISIGGFDMKEREPKYMRKAVPAGSVYYIEVLNKEVFKNIFSSHSINDSFDDINYSNQGFGLYSLAKFLS